MTLTGEMKDALQAMENRAILAEERLETRILALESPKTESNDE